MITDTVCRRLRLIAAALGVAISTTGVSLGDTHTWTGGGTNNDMATAANWSPTGPPASLDDIIFAGTTRLTPSANLGTSVIFSDVTFNNTAGAFTITPSAGQFFEVQDTLTNNSINTQTFNGATRLRGNSVPIVTAATGNLIFNQISLNGTTDQVTFGGASDITINNSFISVAATKPIRKTGAGTLTLHGANTHTATSIASGGGTVRITNAAGLGTGTVTLEKAGTNTGTLELALTGTNSVTNNFAGFNSSTGLQGGGTANILNISGDNTITSNLTVTGTGGNGMNFASNGGVLRLAGTLSSTVASGSRRVDLGGTGTGVVSGNIVNGAPVAFALEKSGSGVWTFTGGNAYSGGTGIVGGRLNVSGTHTGAGNYNVAGGATLGGSGTITMGGANTIFVASASGGGIVSPGAGYSGTNPANLADVGTLTINGTGNVLDMNGVLQLDIVSPTVHDVLDVASGNLDIDTSALLSINGTTNLAAIDFRALGFLAGNGRTTLVMADQIIGNFNNFPLNQKVATAGGEMFFGNDGTSLFIFATPEPSTIILWTLLGVIALIVQWRRTPRWSVVTVATRVAESRRF